MIFCFNPRVYKSYGSGREKARTQCDSSPPPPPLSTILPTPLNGAGLNSKTSPLFIYFLISTPYEFQTMNITIFNANTATKDRLNFQDRLLSEIFKKKRQYQQEYAVSVRVCSVVTWPVRPRARFHCETGIEKKSIPCMEAVATFARVRSEKGVQKREREKQLFLYDKRFNDWVGLSKAGLGRKILCFCS